MLLFVYANVFGQQAATQALVTDVTTKRVSMGQNRFGRFTEGSNRVLLVARLSVSEFGGELITNEHLLLGIVRGAPSVVTPLLSPEWPLSRVEARVIELLPRGAQLDDAVEIPFTPQLDRVLRNAVQEADALGSPNVLPEHLLLALMDDAGGAAVVLSGAGVSREKVTALLRSARGQ